MRERLCGKEEKLAHSQSELEELREQVHLGVYSGEQAEGMGAPGPCGGAGGEAEGLCSPFGDGRGAGEPGLQCEQLARERSEASLRLNEAQLDLESLRPTSPTHCQGDEEERSEGSEPSITSEALTALSEQLAQTAQELQAERALRCHAQTETARLDAQLQATQQDLIPWKEHDKVKAELQRSLQASENSAVEAKEALSVKETELRDLRSQKAVEQGLVSKEDHESQRLSLQAEINAFTAQFNNLTRKHKKTCTEVFQVQREALFNKSECQVADAQPATAQQQLADLQAQSSHVQELHKDIQDSQALVKEKDRKIKINPKSTPSPSPFAWLPIHITLVKHHTT
ncbi:ankyrin repeat domain-containing protein 24-like [Oncorhynchus keta]|uniref:ankyrin repeat domain-containing protein 24-like n=1 Tax=Oncorhynchus keta TaxID=8018 RepID=UPI00227C4D4A|nr:ankyrin repeat domain-containing protein 24-like [Oncorhynchus keta]